MRLIVELETGMGAAEEKATVAALERIRGVASVNVDEPDPGPEHSSPYVLEHSRPYLYDKRGNCVSPLTPREGSLLCAFLRCDTVFRSSDALWAALSTDEDSAELWVGRRAQVRTVYSRLKKKCARWFSESDPCWTLTTIHGHYGFQGKEHA